MMDPVLRDDVVPLLRDHALREFAPLPRTLFRMGLPSTAILLYAVLLDRGTLSQKNGWYSQAGWVYVRFSIPQLSLAMRKGESTIRKNLKILEEEELIWRTQPIANQASILFLRVPRESVKEACCPAENERVEKNPGTPPFFPPTLEKTSA